jgi:hypothetical protein
MQSNNRAFLKRPYFVACVLSFGGSSALGWVPEGHRAVALIAEKNLKPETLQTVKALLRPYDMLAAVSVWADDIREEHSETGPRHYIDIPLSASSTDMNRDCQEGSCVVGKIQEFESALKNNTADPALRRDALKFLLHFVGDMHHPLHCEDNGDKGGQHSPSGFLWTADEPSHGGGRRYPA